MSKQNNHIETLLEVTRNAQMAASVMGSGSSIADIAKIAQIRPIVLFSSSLSRIPEIYDIQQGILNIQTSLYLTSMSLMGVGAVNSKFLSILDTVNPDRSISTVLATLSMESAGNGFTPYMGRPVSDFVEPATDTERAKNQRKFLALEDIQYGLDYDAKKHEKAKQYLAAESADPKLANQGSISTKKLEVLEKAEQVVGKIVEVSFRVGEAGQEVKIPVVISLDSIVVQSDILKEVLISNEESIRFGSRLQDMMSGRIRFWKDFVLCRDLLEQQKRIMMKDSSRALTAILSRVSKSKALTLMSQKTSLNSISSIIMMSHEEEDELKLKIGGGLDNKLVRKMVFDNTMCMMAVVVDARYSTVSVYIRGYDYPSVIQFSRFKEAPKMGNFDELIKTMTMGRAPSF